ncbi:hypothetical protein NYE67_02735 [Solibacillus sp. FSL W8-0474]|uniref:hypothetical protein n=1 Tax=Solibacillus sp. FSL W8-0474 TaxID=2975336 RepID=UPI0030F669E0
MFFKKNNAKVVPVSEYTDYSERFNDLEKMRAEEGYATKKDVVVMSSIPVLGAAGYVTYQKLNSVNEVATTTISEPINVLSQAPIPDPSTLIETYTPIAVNTIPVNSIPQQTGFIADKSLEILANALDPLVQILVAISFPIASVIMVGACFFFMFGNSEKAWNMIMNAGLGYVLIQLSPLFLQILREVGDAV